MAPGETINAWGGLWTVPRKSKHNCHDSTAADSGPRPRIGVSACLLGEKTRYDGGQNRVEWVAGELTEWCEVVPICPEAELGMGIPREPVHLKGDRCRPRMVGNETRRDWTDGMEHLVRSRVRELAGGGLHGFVLKSRSPSCGIDDAELETEHLGITHGGTGLLVIGLRDHLPWLPLINEIGIDDPLERDRFLVRVFAAERVARAASGRFSVRRLRNFHRRELHLLECYDLETLAELDKFVNTVTGRSPEAACKAYREGFLQVLIHRQNVPAQARILAGVLLQLMEIVVDGRAHRVPAHLDFDAIEGAIEDYRRGATSMGPALRGLGALACQVDPAGLGMQSLLQPSAAEYRLRWG